MNEITYDKLIIIQSKRTESILSVAIDEGEHANSRLEQHIPPLKSRFD